MFQCYHKIDVHQIANKRKMPIVASIVDFFNSSVSWEKKRKRKNLIQEQLLEDLVLHITKDYHLSNYIESI